MGGRRFLGRYQPALGGQADGGERPAGPPSVRQLLAVNGDLGLVGAEPHGEPVPAGRAGQPLDLQPDGRFDGQALLGPAQDDPHHRPSGRAAERRLDDALPPRGDRRVIEEGQLQPSGRQGFLEVIDDRGPLGIQPEAPLIAEMRRGDRLRLAGDRPSRAIEGLEAVGQHSRLAWALDDRPDAGPRQRDLAGLPAHAESDRVPRQLAERAGEARGLADEGVERRGAGEGIRGRALMVDDRTGLQGDRGAGSGALVLGDESESRRRVALDPPLDPPPVRALQRVGPRLAMGPAR